MKVKLLSNNAITAFRLAMLFPNTVQASLPYSSTSTSWQPHSIAETKSRNEPSRILNEAKETTNKPSLNPSISMEPSVSLHPSLLPNFTVYDWDLVVNYTDAEKDQMMGLSVALSADGQIVAVGGKYRVSLYTVAENGDGWSKLTNDLCQYIKGQRIALSSNGQNLIVADPGRRKVEVFSSVDDWKQVGNTINGISWSSFGSDVDISDDGERIVVGDADRGHVEVHDLTIDAWTLSGGFGDEIVGYSSSFGASISMTGYGTWMVVGDHSGGLTYIFDLKTFLMVQKVYAECFGKSVDISSDGNIFVTSRDCEGTSSESVLVYVYETESKRYEQFDTSQGGFVVGPSKRVSLSGDGTTVAITTSDDTNDNEPLETVYLHELRGGVWTTSGSFRVGKSLEVSLSHEGTRLIIGAPYTIYGESNSTVYNGHVLVYHKSSLSASSLQSHSVSFAPSSSSVDECSYNEEDDDYDDWWGNDDFECECGILCSFLNMIAFIMFLPFFIIAIPFQIVFVIFLLLVVWPILSSIF